MLKESQIYFFLKIALILIAIAGYNLMSIPLPWVGNVLILTLCFLSLPKLFKTAPVYLKLSLVVFIWAAGITLANLFGGYASLMPAKATSPYAIFLFLRFLDLGVFIAVSWLVYRLCVKGYSKKIIKFIVVLGVVVSAVSIYIYLAQVFDFYYPMQTRMTTGGRMLAQDDTVRYTYDFHRATGPFREPSHLAAWLIIPLFLCFTLEKTKIKIFGTVIILATLLLTGSLTNILALVFGVFMCVMLYRPFKAETIKTFILVGIIFLVSLSIFNFIVHGYGAQQVNLFDTLQSRILPIISEGTEGTNRAYIYNYVYNNPPPFLGYGLGHGNILLSKALDSDLVSSFLNLFLYTVYSLGIIGLVLVFLLLFLPLRYLIKTKTLETRWLIGAYCAWFIIFVGQVEIIPPIFGVLYGLVLFQLRAKKFANEKSNA